MQDCVSTLLGLNLPVLKMVSYFPLYLPVLDMRKIWRTLDIRDERCHHLEWGHYQNHLFTCSPPRSLPCQTVHLPWHIFSLRRKAFPLSRSIPPGRAETRGSASHAGRVTGSSTKLGNTRPWQRAVPHERTPSPPQPGPQHWSRWRARSQGP